jgi:hypothetical protein
MGADGRGAGRRRHGRSSVVGRRETEQEEALVSGGSVGYSGARSGRWQGVNRSGWRGDKQRWISCGGMQKRIMVDPI